MAGSSPAAILKLSLFAPFPLLALFRRLLLLPLLSPLLAALLLAAFNPRPTLSLRLLIWRTPALPIGWWIGAGASGGALLSASAAALALRQGASSQRRGGKGRQEFEVASRSEPWAQAWQEQPPAERVASWFNRPPAPGAAHGDAGRRTATAGAGPQRAPGEPAPTVAVPFRVLHRPGARPTAAEARTPAHSQPAAAVGREAQPEPMAVADDWAQSEGDDW
ncbi:MAG: hypothetical protein WAM11_12115 [Cyanobium sp.]